MVKSGLFRREMVELDGGIVGSSVAHQEYGKARIFPKGDCYSRFSPIEEWLGQV